MNPALVTHAGSGINCQTRGLKCCTFKLPGLGGGSRKLAALAELDGTADI